MYKSRSILSILIGKRIVNRFDLILLIILSTILYRSLLMPGVHIAGDWPCFTMDFIRDYLSWPSAWLSSGLLSLRGGIYNLYRYPVWFVQALIMGLLPDQNLAMLITYFIPIIILPPLGMYYLAYRLFNNRLIAFFAGLAFTFNNVLPWRVALGQPTLAVVMSLMPIALKFYIDCLHKNSSTYAIIFACILSISILYDLRTTYLTVLLIGTYGAYYIVMNVKCKTSKKGIIQLIKTSIMIIIIIGVTQAYQILPIAMPEIETTPLPIGYKVPKALQFLSYLSSFFQILIQSHFGWGLDEGPMMPQTIILLLVITSPLLYGRDSRILYLISVWMAFTFLAKGSINPLGFLNDWLFINVPFFNWFREPLVFQMPQSVPFALLFGACVSKLYMAFDNFHTTNDKLSRKYHLLIHKKFGLSVFFIIIVVWSVWPIFSMAGVYGDPHTSYIAINQVPTGYDQISVWLKTQPSARVLMLPQYPSMMYTYLNYQGVILSQTSIPLWWDLLQQLILENQTYGIAKLLSLYNVRYIILNNPRDIYWQFSTKPYSYYYGVLNHTHGLKNINIGMTDINVFLNELILPPVRIVPKLGLLIGNKMDMIRVMESADLREWAFQFIDQPLINSFDMYSAIIFTEGRGILDIVLSVLNNTYRIPLWNYAGLWGIDDANQWVIGYPALPWFTKEIFYSPKGALANVLPDQTVQMNFPFYAPEQTSYDVWMRLGVGESAGSVTAMVDSRIIGRISLSLKTSLGFKWVKIGSIELQKGTIQIQLTGCGQVSLDTMIIVPHHVFDNLQESISDKIKSKYYSLTEFINSIGTNSQVNVGSVEWTHENLASIHIDFTQGSGGYLVFSVPYDPWWRSISEYHEEKPILAYGFVNMFSISPNTREVDLSYIVQRWLDLGLYISIFSSVLIFLFLAGSNVVHRLPKMRIWLLMLTTIILRFSSPLYDISRRNTG